MKFFKLHGKRIGIDLGTESILVVLESKGIIINEPSIIAIEKRTNEIVAVGKEAKDMIGKTPDKIEALRPMQHAGIANLKATEMIVKDIIKRLQESENIGRPEVLINLHSGITDLEKRALLKVVSDTGAKEVYFIENPLAATIGANLEANDVNASMVVDFGSGTTEVAVVALGEIVSSDSVRIAGADFDEDIINYVKRHLNVEIGMNAAERVKKQLASAKPILGRNMEITGRDLVTGLPKTIMLNAFQVNEALRDSFKKIIEMVKATLERTPPELLADIYKNGIVLTGGGAYIDKMDEFIAQRLGINVSVAENPLECVALGIQKVIESDDKMNELKAKRRKKYV